MNERIRQSETLSFRYINHAFLSEVTAVRHAIPRHEAEEKLLADGFIFSRSCEWLDESPQLTPIDLLPADKDMPTGRILTGDGYKATLRRTDRAYEAVYIMSYRPTKDVLLDLANRNIPVAKNCQVWEIPSVEVQKERKIKRSADFHRRKFFAVIRENGRAFASVGLDLGTISQYYRKSYNLESLSQLSDKQWAIVAAEVQAMSESRAVLGYRAALIHNS